MPTDHELAQRIRDHLAEMRLRRRRHRRKGLCTYGLCVERAALGPDGRPTAKCPAHRRGVAKRVRS